MLITYSDLGLRGRLGNALYELASTIGIAMKHQYVVAFPEKWVHRPYFSVPEEFFQDCEGLQEAWTLPDCWHLDERARPYMQDFSLFQEDMPLIREYLQPSPLAVKMLGDRSEAFDKLPRPILGVHVRRGDNVPGQDPGTPDKAMYHPCPPLGYYLAAIKRFEGQYESIALFSDEPEWAAERIPAHYVDYGLPRPKEHEPDFLTAPVRDQESWFLLSRCDLHVLSNSTFGCMAALVAGDDLAVLPWPFFGPRLDYIDARRLGPASWEWLCY